MARICETTRLHMKVIEATLLNSAYFAGHTFKAADVTMAFPFTTLQQFHPLDRSPYPALQAYLKRIEARPAYAKAMKRSGPVWKAV